MPENQSSSDSRSAPAAGPLTDAGRGAIAALLRVVELYDPCVAHRSALRAVVAHYVGIELDLAVEERVRAVAAAALCDIDLPLAPDPDSVRDVARVVLAATLTDRVPGLVTVATAIRHQQEFWDGTGGPQKLVGPEIPMASRIAHATDQFIGAPAPGFLPTWDPARRRIQMLSGAQLDPEVVRAALAIDTGLIDVPLIPSAVVLDLLETTLPEQRAITSAAAAADIAVAVASAASARDVATLFCDVARRTVDAAEVSMIPLTAASLAAQPVGTAAEEPRPFTGDRLHTLADFSYTSELRAGVPLHRPGDADGLDDLGVGSELNVPIIVDGETWGVLSAARRTDQPVFDDHDVSVLRHIATETASALTNTERWAEIERMALRDQLTGLSNRHVLYSVLDEIFRRDPVDRQDCAVIMCDVDGLKIVNDSLGHEAGDRLLIDAAASLRSAIRDPERSTICRIGGDEFCVVIDGGALLTAHEISDTIERLFARSGGTGTTRSISCGIAFASSDVETRSDLLRAADENQYQTKRARRAARGEPAPEAVRHAGDRRAIRD